MTSAVSVRTGRIRGLPQTSRDATSRLRRLVETLRTALPSFLNGNINYDAISKIRCRTYGPSLSATNLSESLFFGAETARALLSIDDNADCLRSDHQRTPGYPPIVLIVAHDQRALFVLRSSHIPQCLPQAMFSPSSVMLWYMPMVRAR